MRTIIQWKSLLAVLTFESVDEIPWCVQMKATEQYFPVVLFVILYKVVLTFVSVDEILWCDHSNESYWAVFSHGTVYYAVQGGSNFWVIEWNPMLLPFKWKLLSSTFTRCHLFFSIFTKCNLDFSWILIISCALVGVRINIIPVC